MPKVIENVREQLLKEARNQVAKNGYRKTTVRSVAGACNIAVGTVYNYFKSKDMLIASFMADDWIQCVDNIKSRPSPDAEAALHNIYNGLLSFSKKHEALFSDRDAAKVYASVFSQRHKMLRSQLAEIIQPVCLSSSIEDKAFLAEYMAESILRWTMEGKSFSDQFHIMRQLLK